MSESVTQPPASPAKAVSAPHRVAAEAARLAPLDGLRGLIMVVMALDHANAFIAHMHPPAEMWAGSFPEYDSALHFLTRLVTHLAAPGFFFLMGTGMVLFAASRRALGWRERTIVWHLVVRGLILVAFQFLLENRAWSLGSTGLSLYFGVLYGLGTAMIIGTLLLQGRPAIIAGLSIAAILLTHLVVSVSTTSDVSLPMRLLLLPGNAGPVRVLYPPIPWLGIVGLGMIFGRWLLADRERAYQRALWIGGAFLLGFVLLRAWGGWGNIRPAQGTDWISFLNVVKYPPSIVFILMTLGADLVILALFARIGRSLQTWLQPLLVFGASPLFFYIAHLYLYAFMEVALDGRGTGLPDMYPYWILGLAILYPLAWLYGRFKRSQPPDSIVKFF